LALPSELLLRVDERAIFPLTGAGSVGYFWRLVVSGEAGVIEAATGPDHEPPMRPVREPHGGSVPQALFVRGCAPGRVTIRLELVRAGTGLRAPRESYAIVVTVVK
jgi:hypothetical protein